MDKTCFPYNTRENLEMNLHLQFMDTKGALVKRHCLGAHCVYIIRYLVCIDWVSFLGFHSITVERWSALKVLKFKALHAPVAPLPPLKQHKFKYNLPRLDSYEARDIPASFWNCWQKLPILQALETNESWIRPDALREAARRRGAHPVGLDKSCSILEVGADIGCVGRGRLPTRARNAERVLGDGDILCDVFQDWICKGIAAGPLTLEELQQAFGEDFTVNTLTTRPKPTGALRIIVDMSSPRDRDDYVPGWLWPPTLPGAVNTSIDPAQYPAKMSSVKAFIRILYKAGRGAVVCKIDWCDAYKHLKVRPEDVGLQVVQYGGRYFVELKLVFGARSSPGIYDGVSNVIRDIAIAESGIKPYLVAKHLDDILAVGLARPDDPVFGFFQAYLDLAKEVGVRLPPADEDKTKCQSPATSVLALGMEFDTATWEMRCPELKLSRMLHALRSCLAGEPMTSGGLASLVGQLQDKMVMLEAARFNIAEISALVVEGRPDEEVVELNAASLSQMRWWFINLQTTAWFCPIRHPDSAFWPPILAEDVFSDAAGGTLLNIKVGMGALLPGGAWSYFPWPHWLKAGLPGPAGKPLNAQLQFLELCGVLMAVTAGARECRNKALNCRIDNAAGVFTWRKGYSTRDKLSSSVVKAIYDVASHLNSKVFITKVARCSTRGAVAADALSKGDFKSFFEASPSSGPEPLAIPATLVRWLNAPVVDYTLGDRIVEEWRRTGLEVL